MDNQEKLENNLSSIQVKRESDVLKYQMLGEKLMEQVLFKDIVIAHINHEAPLSNSVFTEIH